MNKFVYVRFDKRLDPKPEVSGIYNPVPDENLRTFEFDADPSKIETGGWSRALLVPKADLDEISAGRMTYQKFMVECLVNCLSEFEASMRPNLRRVNGSLIGHGITEHALHEDLLNQFRGLVRTLSWLVHSSSWHGAGPYHDFDRLEINRRLEMLRVRLSAEPEE